MRRKSTVKFNKNSPDIIKDEYEKSPAHKVNVKSRRTRYFKKINKNRDCFDNDFFQCMDKSVKIKKTTPVVSGTGTFGVIVKFKSEDDKDLAVKFIFDIGNITTSSKKFIEMEKELAYSYFMSEEEIGPKVYDTFHYNFDYSNINKYPYMKKIMTLIEKQYYKKHGDNYPQLKILSEKKKKMPVEIQCIIMESYDYDCNTILGGNFSNSIKLKVVNEMSNLIKMQISKGLYCSDIKPANFVANINRDDCVVRMIDFGADFCKENRIYRNYQNEDINPLINQSYVNILHISNILQLYVLIHNMGLFDNLEFKIECQKKLFSDNIFSNFFNGKYNEFINFYIDTALVNHRGNTMDASNMLIWYANGGNYEKKAIIKLKVFFMDELEQIKTTISSMGYCSIM